MCAVISLTSYANCNSSLQAMLKEGQEELNIDNKYVSQNYRARGGKKAKVLILHCVGLSDEWVFQNYVLPSGKGGLGVSAHHYLPQSGKIYQLVSEDESALHAGVSEWRSLAEKNGLKGLNDISIGIEFQSPGYGQIEEKTYFPFSFQPFQPEQTKLGILLSQRIMKAHGIDPENVVWHSDVSPGRKTDPGPLFDGKEFAKNGIGVWPKSNRVKDSQLEITLSKIQKQLMSWGYPNVKQTGDLDELTKYVLQAHYMHYLPSKINWKSFQGQPSGTVFNGVKEWKEFPYDTDELAISLENLNGRHFETF